jgi:hypothetical protein
VVFIRRPDARPGEDPFRREVIIPVRFVPMTGEAQR